MEGLKREIKKLSSLTLFFFVGFGYILIIMKLFLEAYSVNVYILSKALIGALIAAKAVAILDAMPLLNRFRTAPRYVDVLYRTLLYTLGVLFLGLIEHFFEAYRKTKAIAPAIESFLHWREFYNFLAVILCIAVVFLVHNILQELDSYAGKGKLKQFFFSNPRTALNTTPDTKEL